MIIHFSINTIFSKLMVILLSVIIFVVIAGTAAWYLVLGTLTDDRITIPQNVLAAGVQYLPNSPRLQARLANSEIQGADRDLNQAEIHIRRAIELLPGEYTYHLLLASILESQGNREEAEKSYRTALSLAPNYLEVHWRLANNLVRQGKINESIEHFRIAASGNLGLLPNAYDLIWTLSNGNIATLKAITDPAPKAQLMLADFLVRQSSFTEAANIYRRIDRLSRRAEPESVSIINGLIAANQLPLAHELWSDVINEDPNKVAPLIWNGSFESAINPALNQFDWNFKDNEYARIVIDPQNGHSGSNALRLTFLGKDTARIDGEIKQHLVLKSGKKYRLECQYKTRELITSLGPRIVISDPAAKNVIAASEPLPEGTRNWQAISLEFTVPASAPDVLLQIQRLPKYSYDDPSRGVVWFDDFVLKEQ